MEKLSEFRPFKHCALKFDVGLAQQRQCFDKIELGEDGRVAAWVTEISTEMKSRIDVIRDAAEVLPFTIEDAFPGWNAELRFQGFFCHSDIVLVDGKSVYRLIIRGTSKMEMVLDGKVIEA